MENIAPKTVEASERMRAARVGRRIRTSGRIPRPERGSIACACPRVKVDRWPPEIVNLKSRLSHTHTTSVGAALCTRVRSARIGSGLNPTE